MSTHEDFEAIKNYAHFWNWLPDWGVVEEIYQAFPESYSVLTPFAYSYMEEMIRTMTSEYGIGILDESGKPKKRKVGAGLIKLALDENSDNENLSTLLRKIGNYFSASKFTDAGDNRNSVAHGYIHPRFWDKDSFELLLHDIALLSKYSKF